MLECDLNNVYSSYIFFSDESEHLHPFKDLERVVNLIKANKLDPISDTIAICEILIWSVIICVATFAKKINFGWLASCDTICCAKVGDDHLYLLIVSLSSITWAYCSHREMLSPDKWVYYEIRLGLRNLRNVTSLFLTPLLIYTRSGLCK